MSQVAASSPSLSDAWPSDAAAHAHRAADRAARDAYGRLLARLTRRTRNIEAAEDALAHAFAKALDVWPRTGVPDLPEAWLSTVALNAFRDQTRRQAVSADREATLTILAQEQGEAVTVPDARLGLILAAAHPAIARDIHAPLILQTVFGVSVKEMAPAFLTPPETLSQRLVRAKRKIRLAGIAFDTEPADKAERMAAALGAVYGLYTLAVAAPPSPAMAARASDALDLAVLLVKLAPDNAEAAGLAALIAFCEARAPARRSADGAVIRLSKQDTSLWNARLLQAGEDYLLRATALESVGPYQLEAAIQSVHCDRRRTGQTNWAVIATLYDVLLSLSPTVAVAVARAAALAEVYGPEKGLSALEAVPEGMAEGYQPYWVVRAHLEQRLGEGAGEALERAISLSDDEAVRAHLRALDPCGQTKEAL